MKKITAFLLVLIFAVSLAACGTQNPITDTTSLEDVYSSAVASSELENDKKGHYVLSEMSAQKFDGDSENLGDYLGNLNYNYSFDFKEGLCVVPSISGAFQVVIIRLNSLANADEIENELKTNFDKNKWICMGAETVESARIGDVIFLVAGGSEVAQKLVDGFKTAYGS